jgi:hypothetical protein
VKAPPAVVSITQEVADEHGFTLKQLTGPALRRDIARARFVAWHRIREEVRYANGNQPSLPQIGKWFSNRDHTTIMHGLKRYGEIDCSPRVKPRKVPGWLSTGTLDRSAIPLVLTQEHVQNQARNRSVLTAPATLFATA